MSETSINIAALFALFIGIVVCAGVLGGQMIAQAWKKVLDALASRWEPFPGDTDD